MENIKIKNYFNKMSKESQIILVNMLSYNLVYLHDFNVVDKEVIRGISSLIILLMDYKTKIKIKYLNKFSLIKLNTVQNSTHNSILTTL